MPAQDERNRKRRKLLDRPMPFWTPRELLRAYGTLAVILLVAGAGLLISHALNAPESVDSFIYTAVMILWIAVLMMSLLAKRR